MVKLARIAGWHVYHTYRSTRSQPGFPDLTLVRGPRLIFAELKSDTGYLTSDQAVWLRLLTNTCAEVHMWRPKDIATVAEILSPRYRDAPPPTLLDQAEQQEVSLANVGGRVRPD